MLDAIEEGGARGLAARLATLEDEEQELLLELEKAKIKSPRLSQEDVEGWSGDVNDIDFCKRLLETFVAKIDLTNEVAVIYYNISDKKKQKRTIPVCSDTARLLDTTKSYPNPGRPFVYHGYIVLIADLARLA